MAIVKDNSAHAVKKVNNGRDKLSFAAIEAYKFLRTNVMFSLAADEEKNNVFGITSSTRSEGKSTTSVNLAYTIAEDGKNVLLVEADMRLPVFNKRLGIRPGKGLSELLTGMCQLSDALQHAPDQDNLYIIQSGSIPPNPSELLGSKRMEKFIEAARQNFDYVIFDLPPVQAVSDGLVVSKKVDGIVVVVRQDYTDKRILEDTLHQLEAINARVLGVVMTHGKASGGKYGKYGKYKKYGSGDYYKK